MSTRKNKRAYFLALFIFLLALCLYLLRGYYLPVAGNYLVTESELEKADAIFVFGGSIPNRVIEAVDIYKKGYAPLIIISKYPMPEGYDYLKQKAVSFPEGHDINRSVAVQLGIPEDSILITNKRGTSTFDELIKLYQLCKEKNYRKLILVSSKSHTKRISIIFSDITRNRVKGIVRHTRYDRYNANNWWKDRNSMRQTIFEYQKLLHHFLVDRNKIKS